MLDDIAYYWHRWIGHWFSKLFCALWGHPEPVYGGRITLIVNGVTMLEGCLFCGGTIYERSADDDIRNDPNYDPTPCDCVFDGPDATA